MKSGIVFLASACLILIVLMCPVFDGVAQDTSLTDEHGVVTYVKGSVKKKPPDSPEWLRAQEQTEVYSGEKVRTFDESRAEMELRELDVIRLAPNTTIDIVKLYEETVEHRDETMINVEEGDLWALVDEVSADASFQVNSPVAGSAITGTSLRISVGGDSTTQLKVYTGEVVITNAPERQDITPLNLPTIEPTQGAVPGSIQGPSSVAGPASVAGPKSVSLEQWVYIVKNLQQIRIDSRGQVLSSGDFSMNDLDEKSDWVKWNLERNRLRGR